MTDKLTPFQQKLMDAARDIYGAKEHFNRSIERHGQASEISRSRYQQAEAAFRALVERAVDIEVHARCMEELEHENRCLKENNAWNSLSLEDRDALIKDAIK